MKKLYFVRHGLSELNSKGLIAGSTDTPLSEEGRKQAKLAGQQAKKLHIDFITSSPLSRALETAQIIAKTIGYAKEDIHVNKLLTERHFGEMEGQPWAPDLNLDGFSDLETVDSVLERAKLSLDWLNTLEANNILVVSHGSFGRALRSLLLTEYAYGNSTGHFPNAEIVQWI